MPYIYESPDGGHTVFARKIDQLERNEVYQDDHARTIRKQLEEAELWSKIRAAALTNPSIADALNQARILYELSKADES